MKRRELLRKIKEAADVSNSEWRMVRQGKEHEIWQCGATKVSVPRHREIAEGTAEDIQKKLNDELGKDWWR